ncbi:3'(2'),5'-bisphosphate nucleotidase CysQ, partial [Hansschlegelia beijingensis]|uniref:3'(2'),5'-bisphosphate nucleotidase CysQ family protein n=1 Tax=Hansschlegelia beijingensis TaxID=1133344 RepID=UPI00387F1F6E
ALYVYLSNVDAPSWLELATVPVTFLFCNFFEWWIHRSAFQPIVARAAPAEGLCAVASRSHADPQTEAYLSTLPVAHRRSAGSSLKFCLVAEGEADVYPRFGPTMEWDTAAGHAVLAAAGGSVTCPDGGPFRYGKADAGFRNGGFVAWGRRGA